MVSPYSLTNKMSVVNMPNAEKIYQRQITKLGLSSSTFPLLVMRREVDLSWCSVDWKCKDLSKQPIPF